jgi:GDP-L-fucose synthase
MEKSAKIYIVDDGFVAEAIASELESQGYRNILPVANGPKLTDSVAVDEFFARNRPTYVFLPGGKSGGISANQRYPVDLMRDNILVSCHVFESAHRHGVRKLLYLASSCIYPKFSNQPMKVEYLNTGKLEPTNEPYAMAKLAGLSLCRAYRRQFGDHFISAIPANVFGPGDNFDPEDSHVIAALMRRMHEAKTQNHRDVEIWGSGQPRREFIFSDDLARACVFLMETYESEEPVNIGVGRDCSIREIAEMIREVVGHTGRLTFDPKRPDGMPAKLLDSSQLAQMGWNPKTPIREGLASTYEWFLRNTVDADGIRDARAFL